MKADFHINDLTSSVKMEVKIRGMGQFRFRMWIVVCLLRIVSWVSPIEVEATYE
jgi:hypothetical protein